MSNIRLTYDQVVQTKQVTKTSKASGCNQATKTCEFITEVMAPLDCAEGDKIILFLKDPSKLQPGRNGILIGDIIIRTYEARKYEYFIQYSDTDLAEGVLPDTLTQCDVLKACCYDCAAEYSDATSGAAGNPFLVHADEGTDFEVSPEDTLSIVGGDSIETMAATVDTVIVKLKLSTDPGQVATIGSDNNLLVVGGPGGPVDCETIRNCINVDGFITGDGSPTDPFIVQPSTDPLNTVSFGTDGNIFGKSDSIVAAPNSPIGGTQYLHTDALGNGIVLPSGFTSVLAAVGCATPGVGVGKMVRGVTLNSQQLVIDAAPEHSHIVVHSAFNGSPGTDISALGTYNSGASALLNISNITCRTVRGAIRMYWAANVALQAGGVWRFEGRLAINGSPLNVKAATQWGLYPGLTGTVWFMFADIPEDILAGGLLVLQWDMNIITLVASAPGSNWAQFNSGISYQGGTL
jgi:hypothetical protein